jgi:hypothetical protein
MNALVHCLPPPPPPAPHNDDDTLTLTAVWNPSLRCVQRAGPSPHRVEPGV